MLNKIINWTGGGIFRTIGRIIAYAIIGAIIFFIGRSTDFNIKDLFSIERVDALSLYNWGDYNTGVLVPTNYRIFNCSGSNNCSTDVSLSQNTTSGVNGEIPFIMNTSSITSSSSNGTILTTRSSYIFTPGYMYGASMFFCTNKDIGANVTPYTFNSANAHTTPTTNNLIKWVSDVQGGTISNVPGDGSNTWSYCYNFKWAFTTKNESSWVALRVKPSSNTSGLAYSIFGFSFNNYGVSSDTIETAVDNVIQGVVLNGGLATASQVQDVADSVNNVDDTLNDTDTDNDSDDMGDFLNDYEFSNDGTLSTLLTLPITFLENVLTTDSTANLCTTYKNKQICLPSGNMIWGRNDVQAFRTFFNLFVGGILSYKMLRSFIKTSEDAINPNTDKVEVMKL